MPHTRGKSLQECKPTLLAAIASGDRKPWLVAGCGEASFFRWLQKDSQLNTRWYNTPICLSSSEAKRMKARKASKPASTPETVTTEKSPTRLATLIRKMLEKPLAVTVKESPDQQ